MSSENVEIVRRAYEGLAKQDPLGDWSWFFEEFAHDELELHPQGTYFDAAECYRERHGWERFWRDFAEVWDWWHFDVGSFEFRDAGDRVVVLARSVGKGKESGAVTEQDEAHVWTIRDGRMFSAISYVDRARALRETGLAGG